MPLARPSTLVSSIKSGSWVQYRQAFAAFVRTASPHDGSHSLPPSLRFRFRRPCVFVQNPTIRSSPWQEFPQPVALHARCSDSEKQTPFVSQMLGVGALDGRELGVQLIGLRDKSGGGRKANLRI